MRGATFDKWFRVLAVGVVTAAGSASAFAYESAPTRTANVRVSVVSASGRTFTVKVIAPASRRGGRVHLQRRSSGAAWTTIARAHLDRKATARFRVRLPAGKSLLRAFLPRTRSPARPALSSRAISLLAGDRSASADEAAIVAALRERGLPMRPRGKVASDFFGVPADAYDNPTGHVQTWELASEAAAERAAAKVSADGYNIAIAVPGRPGSVVHVDWIAPPHWFRKGRVILLYLGRDRATLAALTDVLGRQFAGQRP